MGQAVYSFLQYVFLVVLSMGCLLLADTETVHAPTINGLSYAAANELITLNDIRPMKEIGADWVSLMPYAFIRKGENKLTYNSERQWVSETLEGIKKDILLSQQAGFKIMLKPHVWISHRAYTGDYSLFEEKDWQRFETSYKEYIMAFARVAEEHRVEMVCIGTEWRKFIKERPAFWNTLIVEIQKVYSGKLTYAANWDEYRETPFWNQLDFIGVNAYFPLSESKNPKRIQLENSWQPVLEQLSELSSIVQKPVLFTEYGYRSIEGTTIHPWESYTQVAASMHEQEVALEVLYNSVWDKKWFAGGFLWKWFNKHNERGGEENIGYTPQNKPAELVVKKYYDIEK